MPRMESIAQPVSKPGAFPGNLIQRHGDIENLFTIAHIRCAACFHRTAKPACNPRAAFRFQRGPYAAQRSIIWHAARVQFAARHLVPQIGMQHAPGGKPGSEEGHGHALHAEFACHRTGMQTRRAPERQQTEIARVNAAPDCRHANPIRHANIRKPVHTRRRRHGIQPKLGAEACKSTFRRRHIQLALATQKIRGIQIAQHQIGICHCGFCAALAIGRRPRHRTRAARAHLQRTTRTNMADGTTTRAKGHDIQAFKRDALTGHIAATAKRGIAFLDQRDIG